MSYFYTIQNRHFVTTWYFLSELLLSELLLKKHVKRVSLRWHKSKLICVFSKSCTFQIWLEYLMIIMLYFFIPRWKRPRNVNGILERYILYISNHTRDFTVWDVIYNNTELFQDHTLQYLLPGNKYLIKLAVSSLCFHHFVCPHHSPCCFPFVSSSLHLSLKKKETKFSCIAIYTENLLHIQSENIANLIPTYLFLVMQNDRITIWNRRFFQI